jgi:uncharacterized protein
MLPAEPHDSRRAPVFPLFSMSDLAPLSTLLERSGDRGNPSPGELQELLTRVQTIAVVGLSRDPTKAARRVPSYLATKGYEVIPVNPFADTILGRKAHAQLREVSPPVDLVLVFRPSTEAGGVIDDACARDDAPAIWLQEGIMAPDAAARARDRGRVVVQDLCIFKVHRWLPDYQFRRSEEPAPSGGGPY